MPTLAWILIGYFVLNALACVLIVGRPRKPLSPGEAAICLVIYSALVWAVVALAS